jgi:hypothetical protein
MDRDRGAVSGAKSIAGSMGLSDRSGIHRGEAPLAQAGTRVWGRGVYALEREQCAHKDFARAAGRRCIQHRMVLTPRFITSGSASFANAVNWCRADRHLLARSGGG